MVLWQFLIVKDFRLYINFICFSLNLDMCGICFVCSLSRFSLEKPDYAPEPSKFNYTDRDAVVSSNVEGLPVFANRASDDSARAITQPIGEVTALLKDPLLHHRGPDCSSQHVVTIASGIQAHMQGCVLHLRGQLTPQPIVDSAGNALMWNGEIFDGIMVQNDENDTQVLFDALVSKTTEEEILKTIQEIQGPWAFIYWQASVKKLWFGRDMFGRRSLLWHLPSALDDVFILSSVALGNVNYTEIPSVGVFTLDFSNIAVESTNLPSLTLHPWAQCRWPGTTKKVSDTEHSDIPNYLYPNQTSCLSVDISLNENLDSWIPDVNPTLPETFTAINDTGCKSQKCEDLGKSLVQQLESREDLNSLAVELIQILQDAVRKRIYNLPRNQTQYQQQHKCQGVCDSKSSKTCQDEIESSKTEIDNAVSQMKVSDNGKMLLSSNVAILFSGGLDSSVLAALADRCVPPNESIDLLNVAFEQPVMKKPSSKKLQSKQRKNRRKFKGDSKATLLPSDSERSLNCPICGMARNKLDNQSSDSLKSATQIAFPDTTDRSARFLSSSETDHKDCKAVDGASQKTEPLGLMSADSDTLKQQNICMHCQVESNLGDTDTDNVMESDPFDVPDRQTGRLALSELNPDRNWNFVEINISQSELQMLRESHIRRLIYPLRTVLDDSIGCAVWFAARGHGVLANGASQPCISKARVILCGMGADEQFAGYSRHRVTFNTQGWAGLRKEIQDEVWRISARNLGRDDRIITDHGKESRFPFLDEAFTDFVSRIPLHQRADLRLPRGLGEKLLLRLSAFKLGLEQTSLQPKRAIQFGSKIAKLDNRKEKGSDVCDRLT